MMTRLPRLVSALAACSAALLSVVAAIDLDLSSQSSIKSAASTIAAEMMTYYHGNKPGGTPGTLDPYYWWEAGAMFGVLIEYWYYTGDTTYNQIVTDGMLFQVGKNDFMPANQTATEGNDDQVFWAFAAMSAAEMNFPNPPSSSPQWLALAQAVFNEQASRWDTQYCGGGLRWQIQSFAPGWTYKNTPSNAGFFQLAARLALYTGNATYADWAVKAYNWIAQSPILYQNYTVFDGTSVDNNCADADQYQWTYNYGQLIAGTAYMYNYTNGNSTWETRLNGFVERSISVLFPKQYNAAQQILVEISCEVGGTCNADQPSFKAYMSRWLAVAAQLCPPMTATILPLLKTSAQGAAAQCSGGSAGTTCGRKWYQTTYDGTAGVGEQMSALSVITANLITTSRALVSANSGGTSVGDPNAGSTTSSDAVYYTEITQAGKAGAGILTFLVLVGVVGGGVWMSI